MCHENKSAVCRVVVRNFRRDGGRPTALGEQALIANHFMGSELEMGWAVALRMEKRELSGVGTCRG